MSKKNTAFASLDAPEFKGNTTDLISVKEGDDVTLNCEAEGNPPPSFHWTRDGVNLMANTSNLSITQVMAGSVYTCTAHNYLGTPTKHIYVDVINTMAGPAVDMTTPAAATQKGILLSFTLSLISLLSNVWILLVTYYLLCPKSSL